MEQVISNGTVNPCCKDRSNLIIVKWTDVSTQHRCKVCERNHYGMTLEPGNFIIKPQPMGGQDAAA